MCAAAVLVAGLALAHTTAHADGDIDVLGTPLESHGFVSQGFILSTSNNYLADETTHGSFEFSEAAINFTLQLTDRLRTGMQLFAHDLGRSGDYRATFDWYYLDYHWQDWLGVRVGRVKLPFGLYNDTSDIDAARVPVLLPGSIYPPQNRDYLLALTGVDLYGYRVLCRGGALDYHLYGGTIFVPFETQPGSPVAVLDAKVPYVAGGRLLWETPLEGLRLGASVQGLELDTDDLTLADSTPFYYDISAILAVASAEYQHDDLLLAAEYARWFLDVDSDNPDYPGGDTVQERGYLMGAYRFTPWLQGAAYYSLYYPDVDHRNDGRNSKQDDAALTLRFDINPHWLVKLEGHFMHGTAVLSPALNDGTSPRDLAPNWGLFLAKTTAYF